MIKSKINDKKNISQKIILSWSGGKDSAMTLYEILKDTQYNIVGLITTVSEKNHKTSLHDVQYSALENQAECLGLDLYPIWIPEGCSSEYYGQLMLQTLNQFKKQGVSSVAFGDLFFEDIRRYREENLSKIGMRGVFPLWKRNTSQLAIRFIELGFKAKITSIDPKKLSRDFVGLEFDHDFLSKLPDNIDPCGEHGEFHTFVYDGPIFKESVRTPYV